MHQNMVQYFYVRLLYQLSVTIMVLLIATISYKIYGHARSNQLERVLRWARPGLVNTSLAIVVIAIDDIAFLRDARETVELYTLTAILSCTGLVFCTLSFSRIWEMVRDMPTDHAEPSAINTWPPAPTRPQ